jgi:hypothetical protein
VAFLPKYLFAFLLVRSLNVSIEELCVGGGFEDRDHGLPQRRVQLLRWCVLRVHRCHLNDPADFWGARTNKMFILTQVANPDASHYGNLVTYLRLNGLVPSGGWFGRRSGESSFMIGDASRP